MAHTSSTLTGVMAAVLSSTGLAVSLSGIGVIAGAPLAGIAGLLGFISTTMTIGGKMLNKEITREDLLSRQSKTYFNQQVNFESI